MAKKNITKIGTQIAFAAAMTAALAMPANADEIDEKDIPSVENVETTPVTQEAEAPAKSNEEIEISNNEVIEENQELVEKNEDTQNSNNEAGENNETATKGELQAPEMEAPEAPVAPETEGTTESEYNENVDEYNKEVDEYNKDAEEYNDQVDEYNKEVEDAEQKQQEQYEADKEAYDNAKDQHAQDVTDYNTALEAYNKAQSDYKAAMEVHEAEVDRLTKEHNAKVAAYEKYLEDLGVYGEEDEEYKAALEAYNKAQSDYKEAMEAHEAEVDRLIKEHNAKVAAYEKYLDDMDVYEQDETDYNTALEAYNKAQSDYKAAMEAHEAEVDRLTKEHNAKVAAYEKYLEDLGAYGEEDEEYKAALEAYNKAQSDYKEAMEAHEAEVDRLIKEHNAKIAAYEKYLENLDTYEQEREKFEQKEDRKEIYDEVVEYNGQVESDNAAIEEANKNLGLGLNAGGTLEEIAESNADLDAKLAESEEGQMLLETLSKENRDKLAADAAELAAEAAALDEEAKKGYELGTEAYTTYLQRVKDYNASVKAYNEALKAYNDAVTEYNKQVDMFNAANVPQQGESNTGNGTQQEEGKVIDWGNVVFGEYDGILTHMDVKYNAAASKTVDENGKYSENVTQYTVTGVYAKQGDKKYGLAYSNDGWKTSTEQTLTKDASNDEFGNTLHNHLGEELDPVNGEIRFFVTLTDSNGKTHEIEVKLDAESVYAEGSYYKAETDYRGNETDFLDRYVGADGRTLEKVLIDGEYYYDISGESVYLISALTCDGMSEETKRVTEGRKTTTVKTGNLTAHGLDLILNMQTIIEIYQAENAQKIIYNQGYMMGKTATATDPGEPGEAPEAPNEVKDPGKLELPGAPEAPTVEHPGEGPGDFTQEEPAAPEMLDRMDKLEYLDHLEEKTIITPADLFYDEPEEAAPWFVNVANNGLVQIIDEAVPLADAPNTGDATALLGFASLFSFGGMYLAGNKKRRRN